MIIPHRTDVGKYTARTTTLTIMAAALLLAFAAHAMATEGFYLGANMIFNNIEGTINPGKTIGPGSGAELKGGFGFKRYFAVEGSFWSTNHDVAGSRSIVLKGYTIDMKAQAHIRNSHIEPFILAGAGNYLLDTESGSGWHYGIGMDIYLIPALNLNACLTKRMIEFGAAPHVQGEVTSMDFGITYHFQ